MTNAAGIVVGGSLIDGTGKKAEPLHWLAFDRDGLITEVAAGHGVAPPRPAGAPVVLDASGRTVMPGLVDAHCHISYGVARGIEEQDIFGPVEYRAIRGMYHARSVLLAGVTAFSDPGGSYFIAVAIRDAIKAGLYPGPRMSAASRYLSTHTALTDYFPSWMGSPQSGVGVLTENVSEMLSEVRNQAKNGVDFIKIAASGESSILTPGGGSVPAFRGEELKVICDEAHRLGKRVTAHARNNDAVAACIAGGVDWLMHGDFMDRRHADLLAESGIPCCPALTFVANIAEWGHLAGCSQARIDRFRRDLDQAVENLDYAWRNGVKLMCGTDSGFAVTPYGEWHARELELFTTLLGMSPLEAITCGTRNSAFTVDDKRLGALEPGRFADLLVVDGDPMADIRMLQDKRRIRAILQGGKPVDLTPQPPAHRYPWERSLAISATELYQSGVQDALASEERTEIPA